MKSTTKLISGLFITIIALGLIGCGSNNAAEDKKAGVASGDIVTDFKKSPNAAAKKDNGGANTARAGGGAGGDNGI